MEPMVAALPCHFPRLRMSPPVHVFGSLATVAILARGFQGILHHFPLIQRLCVDAAVADKLNGENLETWESCSSIVSP